MKERSMTTYKYLVPVMVESSQKLTDEWVFEMVCLFLMEGNDEAAKDIEFSHVFNVSEMPGDYSPS